MRLRGAARRGADPATRVGSGRTRKLPGAGTAEPSPSELRLTGRTRDLLDEIDVRLPDSIVVSPTETVGMAARGLI